MPCLATPAARGCASRIGPSEQPAAHVPPKCWRDAQQSAWYYPLAAPDRSTAFAPTGLVLEALGNIQDLLVVDAQEPGLVEHLTARGAAECTPDVASRTAAKLGVAAAPGGGAAAAAANRTTRSSQYWGSAEGRERLREVRAQAKQKAAALASQRRIKVRGSG